MVFNHGFQPWLTTMVVIFPLGLCTARMVAIRAATTAFGYVCVFAYVHVYDIVFVYVYAMQP